MSIAPALFATILFSLSVISANRSSQVLGGTVANFARLLVATLLLAGWAYAVGGGHGGGAFGWFFLSGWIGFGLGDMALYIALPRLGPRLTILMVQCLAAPFAALAEWLWIGTPLTVGEVFCGLVILAGVAVAITPGTDHHGAARGFWMAGLGAGVVAALGQGLGAVVSRKAYAVLELGGHSLDGLSAAYQRILGGLLFAALPSFWILLRRRLVVLPPVGVEPVLGRWRRAWGWVLANALAGPALGVGCYQWALQTMPSAVVLAVVATTPLVILPLAYLIDGDRPGPRSVLGGMIAVAGVVGLTLAR
jgi:drug/metabolite transporter (DMT)-like permease